MKCGKNSNLKCYFLRSKNVGFAFGIKNYSIFTCFNFLKIIYYYLYDVDNSCWWFDIYFTTIN